MTSARFDPSPPDKSATGRERQAAPSTMASAAEAPPGIDLLQIIGRAEQVSRDYQQRTIQRPLSRAYRAWQNQHAEGSKYLGTAWRGRSRLFVPKTRAAVRKNLATAAGALFSTEDVVNISAQFEDDPRQLATAAVIKADIDYRLQRTDQKSGIPWYLIAMGGCLDAQLTGVTISKQYWQYEEVHTGAYHPIQIPKVDETTGAPAFDENGQPVMEEVEGDEETSEPVMRVIADRPMIELMPIENAGLDPAAPWYAPVQGGRWFYMRFPMGLSDCRAMMASAAKHTPSGAAAESAWLNVPDELLLKGRIEEDRAGSRRVREGGSDRYEDGKIPGDLDIVWIQENFVRIGGKDYHFWSVGRHGYLSKVREVRDAYPELDGERPYAFGVSQLDTHRVFPQSPVDTWQPLQLELNDIANLRLDSLKRSIAPLAIVKRGKNVDIGQLQRRGQPDAVLIADDPSDIVLQQTPGPSGASYTETSVTNASFDELAGVFSTSSVQTSRQLNETVGGMRLMSGSANSVSEFDLRMWVETWVEPALRQLAHLVRYYESDEKIMAVAGQRARVWQRYQYMPTLTDFDQCEITLRVNVGIGALDPMQRLGKLKMAAEMLAPLYPAMQAKGITPNVEAFIEEVMGHAGFKDGRRFFTFGQPQPPQPPPEMIKLQAMGQMKDKEIQAKKEIDAADNRTKLEIQAMAAKSDMVRQVVEALAEREAMQHTLGSDREARAYEQAHDYAMTHTGRAHDFAMAHTSRVHDAGMAHIDRAHDVTNQAAQRRHRINEILAGGMIKGGASSPQQAAAPEARGNDGGAGAPRASTAASPSMDQVMARIDALTERNNGLEQALQSLMQRMVPQGSNPQGQPPAFAPQ